MSDIIPTPEAAARAAGSLRSQRALFSLAPSANWRSCTDALLPATIDTVLPLLDAIAAGRVFEVRPERCADCGGEGGGYIDTMFAGEHAEEWTDCARCDGSGYEPAPPGRKQRTAYAVVAKVDPELVRVAARVGGAL